MEPYGLHSLTALLGHPYLVRNRLAEALYGETGTAPFTRLSSRANGRHRFREEEVAGLLRILGRLAAKLDRRAEKLEALDPQGLSPQAVNRLLDLPELNAKPLIEAAVGPRNYFAFYDGARARTRLPAEWLTAAANELRRFSEEIRTGCETAKREAKQYPFSYGKGKASHL